MHAVRDYDSNDKEIQWKHWLSDTASLADLKFYYQMLRIFF